MVIAVAGSVGKSSTKHAIGIALGAGEKGVRVISSKKNYNNELGVPLTVLESEAPGRSAFAWFRLLLKATGTAVGLRRIGADTLVLEMGTDRPGDLANLVGIAPPQVSVLTAIGPEHTEFFHTVSGVAEEESTIIRCLPSNGIAILNADDAESRKIQLPAGVKRLTFGMDTQATARILETNLIVNQQDPENSGMEVKVALFGTTHSIRLRRAIGRPQAYAIAAALLTVAALDGDDDLAVHRLEEKFEGMPGRMRLLSGVKHTWLIDDSYNSSPLAAMSAVRDLGSFPVREGAKRIAALGDMLELGSMAEDAHIQLGRGVAEYGIDLVVTCGTLAHISADAAKEGGMAEGAIFHFDKSSEAGLFIQDRLSPGDVVLIKGSQGVRMERITKELMAHPEMAEKMIVRQSEEWLVKS